MGLINSKMKNSNKNNTTYINSPLLTDTNVHHETLINGYLVDLVDEEINLQSTSINKNNQILKLKNILQSSFKPKHNVYHEWINLYLWNKDCDTNKILNNHNFDQIYSNEFIENRNINISLILSSVDNYYFIIYYQVYEWGKNFAFKNNIHDNFNFKISTLQSFDKTIEYFANIGYTSINSLKPLRALFEDEYSYEYL